MSHAQPDCLFCRIVAGEIPAEVVAGDDDCIAFRDIAPQAPIHVLVIPREHHISVADAAAANPSLAAAMLAMAARVAAEGGESDYRLVANTGAAAGQSVFHAHIHVLAGRALTWPPG